MTMRSLFLTAGLAVGSGLLPAATTRAATPLALMPQPASVVQTDGTLSAAAGIAVRWEGPHTPILDRAVQRFLAGAKALAGVAAPPPGASSAQLVIACHGNDPKFLALGEKEHYSLSASSSGMRLDADGPAGVLDGLSTVLQLLRPGPDGLSTPYVRIDDRPRFGWRGMMIDTARHFMTLATLERQIDAMERVKLNVLHLHLSDAQGWRVESRLYPKLQEIGSHGEFYTQAQIKGLVAYAADRGIRVVPEFDMPGHALALLQSYPAFAATPPSQLPKDLDPNAAAIDPTNPDAVQAVARLYEEMAALFPDHYFHAGGDEVVGRQWTDVPRIAAYMKAHKIPDADALQSRFTAAMQTVLARHGKIMVGWDEVIAAPIPTNVMIQVWRASKWTARAAKAGHTVLVSAGYYLDLMQPASQHYLVDPLDPHAVGLPLADLKQAQQEIGPKAADFEDEPGLAMTQADDAHVVGGETEEWTEIVSDGMLDSRLWPRAAVVAERFWSPASLRDVDDMYRRMAITEDRLDVLGLRSKAQRMAMTERLAPGNTESVTELLSALAPARNYSLHEDELQDRTGAHPLALNGLPDIAEPDPEPTLHFSAQVQHFLAGDRSAAPDLQVTLTRWQRNDGRYAALAEGNGALSAALPLSHDLALIASAGSRALGQLETSAAGTGPSPEEIAALKRQEGFLAAADSRIANRQASPVDGLLMPAVRPVQALVDAAARMHSTTQKQESEKGRSL